MVAQLAVGLSHRADDDPGHLSQERVFEAETPAEPDGAPHDAAQHVAAPLVGGHDAVGDQERRAAGVLGDDAHRVVVVAVGAVLLFRYVLYALNQWPK